MLIPLLAFGVAALAHRYLQMYAPSNAIVARVRRERPRSESPAVCSCCRRLSRSARPSLLTGWRTAGQAG